MRSSASSSCAAKRTIRACRHPVRHPHHNPYTYSPRIHLMTKQVQLSDDAYAALKARKRPGESFSQAVLRLSAASKDPWLFVGRNASELSIEEHLGRVKDMRRSL